MKVRRLAVVAIGVTALVAGSGAASYAAPGTTEHEISAKGRGGASSAGVMMPSGATDETSGGAGGNPATRGKDGRPTGSHLAAKQAVGERSSTAASAATAAGAPNNGQPKAGPKPLTAPTIVKQNFTGLGQANSNFGGEPPDVNAAVGQTQYVETVNTRIQVYRRTDHTAQCGFSLRGFTGASEFLFDPRVQYDNANNRFSAVMALAPASSSATPAIYVAASRSADACAGWWIYRVTFSGGLYPAGTMLDYPYLGQDSAALLLSSNNFGFGGGYLGSAAFAIPKAAIYSGGGFSFPAFPVSFSTAPPQIGGIPLAATNNSYFLASVPGSGYDLYRMTNSAGPGTTMTLQANISSPFSAPTRRVNQPGTSQTLDPLDGRIQWQPYQIGDFLWFAHGIDFKGWPSVRYGAIGVTSNTPFVAVAYRSKSSDDFNPSIGVSDAGGNTNYIFVNWAYTDTASNIATSNTIDAVLPGAGVPNLIGTGLVTVKGHKTTTNSRFGDYSSVSMDPNNVCRATAAQQFFGMDGNWRTRIADVAFC